MKTALNLPNTLTAFRLLLAPVFAWLLYTSEWLLAGIIFIIAAASDIMDGYLARKLNEESDWGRFFDPVADKLFFGLGIIVLIIKYDLPAYYFLAITRDVLLGVGSLYAWLKLGGGKRLEFFSSRWGKATTVLQACTIMAIGVYLFNAGITVRAVDFLVLVTFILSIITTWHYFTIGIKKGYI